MEGDQARDRLKYYQPEFSALLLLRLARVGTNVDSKGLVRGFLRTRGMSPSAT